MLLTALFCLLCPLSALAASAEDVVRTGARHFAQMPQLRIVDRIAGHCGATASVHPHAAYCTTQNTIFLAADAQTAPDAGYLVAHLLGHAAQVRNGVADVALRTIRANRAQEETLRRDVTRMVECIAGVILRRAGAARPDLTGMYRAEPFTQSHWGRDPLHLGPQVTMGLAERNEWLGRGYDAGHPRACDTGSFPADLLVTAFRP